MRTCRILYEAGIPHLLCKVRINLNSAGRISPSQMLVSFSLFICADPARHNLLVRELEISIEHRKIPNVDSQSVRTFAQVLKQFHNLLALKVCGAEYWLGLDSSLEDALSTLPNLQAISFNSRGYELATSATARVLKRLASPVRVLDLRYPDTSSQNLLDILRNFASTLEHIALYDLTLKSDAIVYPRLKSVQLWGMSGEEISESISSLIVGAPKLNTINLQCRGCLNIEEVRDSSILAQQRHQPWHILDSVQGNLTALYALGIQCRARAVILQSSVLDSVEHCRHMKCVLQEMRPSTLSMSMDVTLLLVSDITSIIPASACQDLTHLSIDIFFYFD